ncbi:MAG: M3 family metallopeptidase [Lautropia sp.]|nr:M3 family metallopeptidase [Lautropia sp.]
MTASQTATPHNPLLDGPKSLPRFSEVRPEHVSPALDTLLAEAEEALTQVTADGTPATWQDVALPLQRGTERLSHAWGLVQHLNSVADSPALRETFNQNLPRVVEFWTRLGQNSALFSKYKALKHGEGYQALDGARRKALDNEVRDFTLSGAELQSPARERFAAIQEELAALTQRFSENVLDATNAFELIIPDTPEGRERLAGLPDDAVTAARADAERQQKSGYRFTLHFPSYFPVIQYAHDRSLRETLYRAYVTRAAEGSEQDNTALMHQILALRQEKAQLLGYHHYAELSLVPKMADSPGEVEHFLRDLARRARPFAEKDLAELRAFARETLGMDTLEAWDLAYASEALKQARYAFSDNEVKQYFSLPRVLDGLFRLIERLFGVVIKDDQAEGWHPDVRFYRIESKTGELVGQFYLDLYAREAKQPGAWMNDCRGRHHETLDGSLQTPIAYLVCNFQAPVNGRPALLTHDDVTTLFHEFGHGLHHLLTRVDTLAVSGISGVEWDAVELPSQFMENWAWEWDIVESMTAHVDTGEKMPRALFDKMLAARNFQAGLQTLRQIEFAVFDMLLHQQLAGQDAQHAAETTAATSEPHTTSNGQARQPGAPDGGTGQPEPTAAPGRRDSIQQLLDRVREEVAVLVPPAFNRFQNSFSHIFAGGYAAGYYSYKWAEVLSADCYAAFEEATPADPTVGERFLTEILSVGGSRPAIDSFKAFRGRAPELDALLRHNGMVETVA